MDLLRRNVRGQVTQPLTDVAGSELGSGSDA